MYSIRRWFYRPKKEDSSKLAQFYWADEELNMVAAELDSFDGRKDPERCSALVNQLRLCQDKVLTVCSEIMDQAIPDARANRDFQAKFPDDVLQENLSGQLWFGAECLAAGSNILNRETESATMRPLAKALTRALDNVRFLLREQCLRNPNEYTDKVKEALWIFDRLFAEFELCYVSTMVPVKTANEFHLQQEVIVLFSETLQRALRLGLVKQDLVDDCDPSLMFTIPRLATVGGLLLFPDGPLNVDKVSEQISELFRPFHSLLFKIRDLLWTLSPEELLILEKTLCSFEEPEAVLAHMKTSSNSFTSNIISLFPSFPPSLKFHNETSSSSTNIDQSMCIKVPPDYCPNASKQFIQDFYAFNFGPPNQNETPDESEITRCTGLLEDSSQEQLPDEQIDKGLPHELLSAVTQQLGTSYYSSAQNDEDSTRERHDLEEIPKSLIPDSSISRSLPVVSSSRRASLSGYQASPSRSSDLKLVRRRRRNSSILARTSVGLRNYSASNVENLDQSHSSPLTPRLSQLRQEQSRRNTMQHISTSTCHTESTLSKASVSTCSSCSSLTSLEWEHNSEHNSSDTSSFRSDCQDDQEIALALQAAEIASCHKARSRFKDSTDLIHRLFVCISGVADQLQTNFASDLRNILKCVFEMNRTQHHENDCPQTQPEQTKTLNPESLTENFMRDNQHHFEIRTSQNEFEAELSQALSRQSSPTQESPDRLEEIQVDLAQEAEDINTEESHEICLESRGLAETAPCWLPDDFVDSCMSCHIPFTIIRRRHHCRNCGNIFCARCSSNSVPLPRYGHTKPVRVCNNCFVCQVAQLLVPQTAS